ncbi:TonB-dependent receptor [Flagellimonas sp. HMM57]|uniref:TonB-dependent receptor n=1 Tax=unclassified Flagellimonas TaxID=2644544 RepID=UPI0013D74168|nr:MULTISPECIES: TonB-dependent receptor [unclassified Flagellimonas]UII75955.1 TonB-dependent receptor [Flagellimonas sp. HMM57]
MKLRPLLLFLFISFFTVAQKDPCTYSVSGKVLDVDTKEPIPYAVVKVDGTKKYTSTNAEGHFSIDGLCSEKNTLIISCVGYADSTKEHEHDSNIHFYLTQKVTGLEEVTIQAQRTKEKGTETISQITIGKSEIASSSTQSLAAVLSQQQGLTFISTGNNVQLPVIHGLYGNRILVLNNGLKHGFQNWGTDHAPEIDISSANSITVVKGAAGVRYGPEALGGAIIIEPNPLLLNNPLYAEFGTGYETNGRGYNTNLEVGGGTENWSFFANGNYTRIGDRNAPDYSLTNSGKEEKAFSFGVLRHLNKWDFKINYSFVDQNLALLRSSIASSPESFIRAINSDEPNFINPFSYDINEPNQTTQHHLAKAEVNWWYKEGARLTLIGGVQLNKRDEFDVRRNSELPIIDLDLTTLDYQLEWKHSKWNGLDGLLGVQYFSQNNDNNPGTQTTPFIPNYNTDRFSAFAIESFQFGRNTLEAGLRFDYETNDVRGRETNQDIFRDNYNFTNFTGSLGFVRQLSENSTFRTNLGTAWRTPNMEELFSFGQHGFKTTFGLLRFSDTNGQLSTSEVVPLDESDVNPERGYKFINEFQTSKNDNTHNLTIYSHYIENYIFDRPIGVFGTIRGPMPAFIFDQVDALFFGGDYSWKKDWTKNISGVFGFSYLWSRNIGDNEPLINQPPVSTSFELRWDQGKLWMLDSSKWTIRPSYTFQQFQAPRTVTPEDLVDRTVEITTDSEIFDFADAPEGYFLLDLSWNFKWKNLSGSITAQNLLNTSYRDYLNEMRYFADEPGRNILFTLNYFLKAKKR